MRFDDKVFDFLTTPFGWHERVEESRMIFCYRYIFVRPTKFDHQFIS